MFAWETIQTMTPKTKPFGHLRMVKGAGLPHAEAFHYSARPEITDRSKGDNFFQPEQMEADAKGFLCCLGSKPFAPMRKRKTPPNLNARRKGKFRRWPV